VNNENKLTDLRKLLSSLMCELGCYTKLLAFLINWHEVSINYYFYNLVAHESLRKGGCGPRS
jgi:hypothetical protein